MSADIVVPVVVVTQVLPIVVAVNYQNMYWVGPGEEVVVDMRQY